MYGCALVVDEQEVAVSIPEQHVDLSSADDASAATKRYDELAAERRNRAELGVALQELGELGGLPFVPTGRGHREPIDDAFAVQMQGSPQRAGLLPARQPSVYDRGGRVAV